MKTFLFVVIASIFATVVAMIRDFLASRDYAKRGWSTEGLSKDEARKMAAIWFRVGYRKSNPEAKVITHGFLAMKAEDKDLSARLAPIGLTGHLQLLGDLSAESMDETMSLHRDSPFGSLRRTAWLTMEGSLIGYGVFITICLIGMHNHPIPGFEYNWVQLLAKYCSLPWGIAVATTGYLAGLGLCLIAGFLAMVAGIIGAIGAYLHHLFCLIPSKA